MSDDMTARAQYEWDRAEKAEREASAWAKTSRDTFDALCAMRNDINEVVPLPSIESDLLRGPENSVFCATVAEAVVGQLRALAAERDALKAENERLREALTPSGDTKAAYMGEFGFTITMSHPRLGEEHRRVDVPWTCIKEIMATIHDRAALQETDNGR